MPVGLLHLSAHGSSENLRSFSWLLAAGESREDENRVRERELWKEEAAETGSHVAADLSGGYGVCDGKGERAATRGRYGATT